MPPDKRKNKQKERHNVYETHRHRVIHKLFTFQPTGYQRLTELFTKLFTTNKN